MTAASKLKSAAVVEGEVKRKTSETRVVEVASITAVNAASFKSGSTTATATKPVVSALAENATEVANTGSRAATNFRAASLWATRLPVPNFPKISNTQRIQYPLGQALPEGILRTGCAG